MADNKAGFDGQSVISVVKKLFNFIDRAFSVLNEQYAEDGSIKYDVPIPTDSNAEDGSESTVVHVVCVPVREGSSYYDVQIKTDASILKGDNPITASNVQFSDIPEFVEKVVKDWFDVDLSNAKKQGDAKEDSETEEVEPEEIEEKPEDAEDVDEAQDLHELLESDEIDDTQKSKLRDVLRFLNDNAVDIVDAWFSVEPDKLVFSLETGSNISDYLASKATKKYKKSIVVTDNEMQFTITSSLKLRFGIKKITGSSDVVLTKVFANYDSQFALSDLSTAIENIVTEDTEDECEKFYEVTLCDRDECLDIHDTDDFSVYNVMIDVVNDTLCSLYEIKVGGKIYQKQYCDPEYQKFYAIDITVSEMIDTLESWILQYTQSIPFPYPMFEDDRFTQDIDDVPELQIKNLYIPNLTKVVQDLNLFLCNFDKPTQDQLTTYQDNIGRYLENFSCSC